MLSAGRRWWPRSMRRLALRRTTLPHALRCLPASRAFSRPAEAMDSQPGSTTLRPAATMKRKMDSRLCSATLTTTTTTTLTTTLTMDWQLKHTTMDSKRTLFSTTRRPWNEQQQQQAVGARAGAEPTFVSAHYRINQADIETYLSRKRVSYKEKGDKIVVSECPSCPPTRGKPDNMWKLYIWRTTGSFFCHRCGDRGSWFDLKRQFGDLRDIMPALDKSLGGGSSVRASTGVSAPRASQSRRDGGNNSDSSKHNGGNRRSPYQRQPLQQQLHEPQPEYKLPDQAEARRYMRQLENHEEALEVLMGRDIARKQRGLSLNVLRKYGVGVGDFKFQDENGNWVDHASLVFPWTSISNQRVVTSSDDDDDTPVYVADNVRVDRLKIRSLREKRHQRLAPAGGSWGMFGWHTVPPSSTTLVITEGEFDAMAVHQATGMPAVSLPNGARSLPVELLPMLERFEKIYLWMDDDLAGQEGAEKFARKLGLDRCLLVRPPPLKNAQGRAPKDANEALLLAYAHLPVVADPADKLPFPIPSIQSTIMKAMPVPHQEIARFTDLRQDIFREVANPSVVRGLQSRTLPRLSGITKGHRKGELTIVTGGTGVGKTTVLSQLSVDLCDQGVNTLWGSFEIKNTRLAKTMLTQFSNDDLQSDLSRFEMWADRFAELPMQFLRFFGSTDVNKVLDAMEYAVYVHDVEHVVLDNLQFMLSGQGRGGYDKFDLQDRAIEMFRQFATSKNIHITLVIHPRKEPHNSMLSLSSVFGSAKATQEADNVLIIQQGANFRTLEVHKNRFDGELGCVPFKFDKTHCRIVEIGDDELRTLGYNPTHVYKSGIAADFVNQSAAPAAIMNNNNSNNGRMMGIHNMNNNNNNNTNNNTSSNSNTGASARPDPVDEAAPPPPPLDDPTLTADVDSVPNSKPAADGGHFVVTTLSASERARLNGATKDEQQQQQQQQQSQQQQQQSQQQQSQQPQQPERRSVGRPRSTPAAAPPSSASQAALEAEYQYRQEGPRRSSTAIQQPKQPLTVFHEDNIIVG